ncbi:MAG: PAS domain S-box protein [Candidatus Tantalella remota]|nr:PAS domain S-box protein [Candidatus Tantalella remota]
MATKKTNIVIIGGGKGGAAIVELFKESDSVNILCVVDIDLKVPAIKLAKELGIEVCKDYTECVNKKGLDEIINVTGLESVQKELLKVCPPGVEVIGGHSAKLFWQLMYDKQETEKGIEDSEKRYKTLFNASADGVLIVDAETEKCKFANPAMCGMLGYTAEELAGNPVESIHPKDDVAWVMEAFDKVVRGEIKSAMDIPCQRKNGTIFFANINVATHVSIDGKDYLIGFFRDVTENKAIREELEESEEKYRMLVESANTIILEIDREGTITFFNKFAQTFFGFSKEEIIGKKAVGTIVPQIDSNGEDLEKVIEDVCAKPENHTIQENENIKKNGEKVWIRWQNRTILDDEGNYTGILAIGTDLTERMKHERELKKLSHAVEQSADIIMITSKQGKVEYVNPRFYKLTGYAPEEIIGKDAGALGDQSAEERGSMWATISAGEEWRGVFCNHKKNGELYWEAASVSAIRDESGEIYNFVKIAEDITEKRHFEEELKRREEKYRLLVEGTGEPIIRVSKDGTILFVNTFGAKSMGISPGMLIGKKLWDIFPKEISDAQMKSISKVIETGEPMTTQSLLVVGGKEKWYDSTLHPEKGEDGDYDSVLIIAIDITAFKKATDELKLFRALVDQTNDAIFLLELDTGYIVDVNEAACRSLGYTRKKILSKKVGEIEGFVEDVSAWKKHTVEVVKRGGMSLEGTHKRSDGTVFPVEVNVKPVTVEGKNYMVAVARDITERKKIEEQISRQSQLLRNVIANIPYFVFWKDRNSVYAGCNENFAKVAGVEKPENIVGKTDYDLVWKREESDSFRSIDKKVMNEGHPMLDIEEPQRQMDGKERIMLTSKVPLTDDDGNVIGLLGIYTDITERKYLEDVLRESETMYRTIFETTGTVMAILGAEMRIVMANSEFEKFFGYSKEEIEGKKSILEFVCEEEIEKITNYYKLRRIDPLAAPRNYELKVIDAKGKVSESYITVALVPGTKRSVISVLDITELKRNEFELKRQKDLLDNMNKALEHKLAELQEAMSHIKRLEGLVPICANCKKMRVEGTDPKDENSWVPLEKYVSDRTDASFTHGLCPECIHKLYGDTPRSK